jgi:hypothetical protein
MNPLGYGGIEATKLQHLQLKGGLPVSAFCSMFSQLLKLLPRTEFQALVKLLGCTVFTTGAQNRLGLSTRTPVSREN